MNKLKYLIVFIGLSVFANSCVEPEDPTNVQILTGEWEVKHVIANGEVSVDNFYQEQSVLHLDRNETFLFINVDGRAESGVWTADENQLNLTPAEGDQLVFEIVYSNYDKLHAYYSIDTPIAGEIELRYLFERID